MTTQAVVLEVLDTGATSATDGALPARGSNGAGLGLTIVRSVVACQGRALRFAERTGGRTRVSVVLPTAPPAPSH